MHVIVCIKQVPDTTNVKINPETNTLMRDGVESILNPFDEYALEMGLKAVSVRVHLSRARKHLAQALLEGRDAHEA